MWWLPLPQRKGTETLLWGWSGLSKNGTGLKKQKAQETSADPVLEEEETVKVPGPF